MITTDWKYAFASVVGTSHTKMGVPCQDRSSCTVLQTADGSSVLVAVIADGAGSAQRAEIGASVACSLFIDEMRSLFESGGTVQEITRSFVAIWLTKFRDELIFQAETEKLPIREFACTILGTVIGFDCAAFFQIGDGAIVTSSKNYEDYNCVFWPQKGEYENITTFAIDQAVQDKLDYKFIEESIEEVALFTDGLQHLALHYQTQKAFTPFFRSMLSPLHSAGNGHLESLSFSLASFLNSEQVNSRTDDDKTLVLATKRRSVAKVVNSKETQDSKDEDASL